MKARPSILLTIFILLSIFAACRVGPNYHPPCSETPDAWKAPVQMEDIPCDVGEWWEVFEDERLNQLEKEAITNNPDLYIAVERVFEARAIVGEDAAKFYPHISLDPYYSSTGTLFKLYGIPPNITNLFGLQPILRVHELNYFLPINLSYEVDLWGKIRSQYDSALWNMQAQMEAYNVAVLSLTSELASNYFNMRSLDTQVDYLRKAMNLFKQELELNQLRFEKGLVNKIDVTNAELQLANAESAYYDYLRQRNLFENAIAALMGIPASDLRLDPLPLTDPPPTIPAGVPSMVLLQRPDIAEAERTMASQHALINVAVAEFFPSFTLTGALGFESPDLRLFLSWKSRYWQIAALSSQSLFDGGKRISQLNLAYAQFMEAEGNYRKVVLTAFKEVEDALNNIEMLTKEYSSLDAAVKAATETRKLASSRYKSGLVNYLEVIDSERQEVAAQQNAINILGQRYQSTVQLIKALGGSW